MLRERERDRDGETEREREREKDDLRLFKLDTCYNYTIYYVYAHATIIRANLPSACMCAHLMGTYRLYIMYYIHILVYPPSACIIVLV